jgi:hypothetical protein
MRIAESVSHRIFERTLRLSVFREARLFERHYTLQAKLDVGRCGSRRTPGTHGRPPPDRERSKTSCQTVFVGSDGGRSDLFSVLESLASDQAGIPAELKHINKRRKRNQQGLPQ